MKYQKLIYLSSILIFLSCSKYKVYIPGNFERRPVFNANEEIDLNPTKISDAAYYAEEYPNERVIYKLVKVQVDFTINDAYDSSAYLKLYEKEKTSDIENKKDKLTTRPVPDGQLFMNTHNNYSAIAIKDYIDYPIVLHYNSMTKIKDFEVRIDQNEAILEKNDETSDGDEYFKTDSRYEYYNIDLPVRGSEIEYKYNEFCRDAKFSSVIYLPERNFAIKKIVTVALNNLIDYEIVEMNFGDLKFMKDTVEGHVNNDFSLSKKKYLRYTFYNLNSMSKYGRGRGPSYSYPLLYFQLKRVKNNNKTSNILRNTDDLYEWYKLVSTNLKNDTSVFASFTKNLVKDKKTDLDKIKTVYYWVQDNIRYIAFEDGIAGFRAEESAEVFKKKYGDCKGMANLTKSMLNVLGFDARMVIIGTKHLNFSYEKPGLPVDNHAICAVKLNGKFLFLDGTENYCAINEYANRIQGRQCIVENGEKYSVETVPQFDYLYNENKRIINLKIENQLLVAQVKQTYKGESKLDFIRSYNYLNSENKDELLYHYLNDNDVNIKVKNIKTSDLSNREGTVELNYQLDIKNRIIETNNQILINLEFEREFEGFNIDSNQKVDFDFDQKHFYDFTTTLTLNAGQKVLKLPKPVQIDNEFYTFKLEMKQVGNTIIYQKIIITKKDYLPKEKIKQFVKDCSELSHFYNSYIFLSK